MNYDIKPFFSSRIAYDAAPPQPSIKLPAVDVAIKILDLIKGKVDEETYCKMSKVLLGDSFVAMDSGTLKRRRAIAEINLRSRNAESYEQHFPDASRIRTN